MNDELDDGALINFAAILSFLVGLGGVNNLQKTSKYKLQSVHSHSTGQCDHMVKVKMPTGRQVDFAERASELAEMSGVARFRNSHNLSFRIVY